MMPTRDSLRRSDSTESQIPTCHIPTKVPYTNPFPGAPAAHWNVTLVRNLFALLRDGGQGDDALEAVVVSLNDVYMESVSWPGNSVGITKVHVGRASRTPS